MARPTEQSLCESWPPRPSQRPAQHTRSTSDAAALRLSDVTRAQLLAVTAAAGAELRAAAGKRTILASFKGVCQGKSNRPALSKLHNGRDLVMLCTGRGGATQWDYKALMLSSTFSVAPAGNGLHSFRLAEAIFFGSIPVIVDDQIVLPYCSALDWTRFSVRIHPSEIGQLPSILRAIPPERVAAERSRVR